MWVVANVVRCETHGWRVLRVLKSTTCACTDEHFFPVLGTPGLCVRPHALHVESHSPVLDVLYDSPLPPQARKRGAPKKRAERRWATASAAVDGMLPHIVPESQLLSPPRDGVASFFFCDGDTGVKWPGLTAGDIVPPTQSATGAPWVVQHPVHGTEQRFRVILSPLLKCSIVPLDREPWHLSACQDPHAYRDMYNDMRSREDVLFNVARLLPSDLKKTVMHEYACALDEDGRDGARAFLLGLLPPP